MYFQFSNNKTTADKVTKGNSDFCRSSTEIWMFAHISVEVLQKSVKVFEKNWVQQHWKWSQKVKDICPKLICGKKWDSSLLKWLILILLFSWSSTYTEICTSLQISVDNNLNMSLMLTEICIIWRSFCRKCWNRHLRIRNI